MTDWADAGEIRAELDAARDQWERLVDKLIESFEADDPIWTQALLPAVKGASLRVKHLRRLLRVEVA